MKHIQRIEFYRESKEERLPDFSPDFPYFASCGILNRKNCYCFPWHWHKTMELFYVESGSLDYHTPQGKTTFAAGSGGLVNSNVLHMTKSPKVREDNVQFTHLFDPSFIAGARGSKIEQKYVTPIITSHQVEKIALYPDDPDQAEILKLLRQSFELSEQEMGYEMKLREALSEIWIKLFVLAQPLLGEKRANDKTSDKIKLMMVYIHEHFAQKITVEELAAAAFSSQRECFRLFRDCLRMTPVEYMKSYRLQKACQMLAEGQETITSVAQNCGLGSSSYFGRIFRDEFGCTPIEYRRKWQDSEI